MPPPSSLDPSRSSLSRAGAVVGGRYRLRAPIGAGAMGEVWLADHLALGTRVAVKLVDTARRPDADEILARFHQEARAAAQLRSPHVVQILDHGADDGVAFIAMELLEGESLERRLERRGALLPGEVAHVVREIARGIERAHAVGIVHRDLKPPNVFLARVDGLEIVKVLDFGIAKILGAPRDAHLQTQDGFVVGTPAYMSPEQVLGKAIDARSDLWQLGVIAFECLTGRRPFEGGTLGKIFQQICSAELPVPSKIAGVPAGFDAWFARALSREPAGRFATAGELADALAAVLAPDGIAASTIPTLSTPQPRAPAGTGKVAWSSGSLDAPRSIGPGVVIVALVALALPLAAGIWLATARGSAAPAATAAPPRAEPTAPREPTRAQASAPSASASAALTASADAAKTSAPAPASPRAPSRVAPAPAPTADRLGI